MTCVLEVEGVLVLFFGLEKKKRDPMKMPALTKISSTSTPESRVFFLWHNPRTFLGNRRQG